MFNELTWAGTAWRRVSLHTATLGLRRSNRRLHAVRELPRSRSAEYLARQPSRRRSGRPRFWATASSRSCSAISSARRADARLSLATARAWRASRSASLRLTSRTESRTAIGLPPRAVPLTTPTSKAADSTSCSELASPAPRARARLSPSRVRTRSRSSSQLVELSLTSGP